MDYAFGGKTRRQWQSIKIAERNSRIVLDYQCKLREAQQQPKSERIGTPSETACREVAKLHGLKNDNVRLIVQRVRKLHCDAASALRMIKARPIALYHQKKLPPLIIFSFEQQLESKLFTPDPPRGPPNHEKIHRGVAGPS